MSSLPEISSLQALTQFKEKGYRFIQDTCDEHHTDYFKTRLLFKEVVCMRGKEAAQFFYDPLHFVRSSAIPKRVQRTLLGEHGVQTLDAENHRVRKGMFMSLMSPESITKLMELISNYWLMYIRLWEKSDRVVLFNQTQEIFCRAACHWAGVPLEEEEVRLRSDDFTAMVDAFGAIGPRHWRGRDARRRTEEWIAQVIDKVHQNEIEPADGSVLQVITSHRQPDGTPIDKHVTAVEIINMLRPIVAISYYVTFAALAVHRHPHLTEKLKTTDATYLECFVQEVRRFYPFAPFVGARVKDDTTWQGMEFKKDALVLLDIYGTNHDPKIWKDADQFIPERFESWNEDAFSFIHQGGGRYDSGHRCAGERITIEAMKVSLVHLVNFITYDLPPQNLHFSMNRIPTYPESGFIMQHVKAKESLTPTSSSAIGQLV